MANDIIYTFFRKLIFHNKKYNTFTKD